MGELSRHVWLVGSVQGTRAVLLGLPGWCDGSSPIPAAVAADEWTDRLRHSGTLLVDCRAADGQRASRAPACAGLVRQIVPWMLVHDPAGVRRNNLTVYLLAPDLFARTDEDLVPVALERDMSRGELLRLADGLAELLFAWGGNGAATVAVEHAEAADPVDQALLAGLVRLLPPELVRLVVCSTTSRIPGPLRTALVETAVRRDVAVPAPGPRAGCECV